MRINPYLIFDGQCETAFRFYAECLGGTLTAMLPYRDTPASEAVPETHRDRIIHACLEIGGQRLMASDTTPDQPYEPIRGSWTSLNVDSVAEAERIFDALAAGGETPMPMAETFWAQRFGMCIDRYGVPWMVNCDKPAPG